ncbi:hypothetical protein Gmet_3500 [Geobacter metallireducens GS-15]|uniref:Uncharacterized protein n=1 Tax=Geobacter metallireducens (strain ATCC 53774 / DSM 7210 / GS-15) TaxID=269799 RepID=Q39PW9_GEOMG|nr:hypothetical protein Gmet_3500 [Geobacter metallireducens GS-15]
MKEWRVSLADKRVLWPVIVTVSLVLVFLGTRTPNIARPQKPTSRPRAVIETQVKTTQAGIEKHGQAVELCHRAEFFNVSAPRVSAVHFEPHKIVSSVLCFISARAPPLAYA